MQRIRISSAKFYIGVSIGIIAIVIGATFFIHSRQNLDQIPEPSSELNYRYAPNFELTDWRGKKQRLGDQRGSVVLIHFWASWCPPCLDEIPKWIEFANRFKGKRFKFIAISLDQNWRDALKIVPGASLPSNVLSLLDDSGKVAEDFGSYQFPETYLLSPDLKIITKWVGPQEWNNPKLIELLDRMERIASSSAQGSHP